MKVKLFFLGLLCAGIVSCEKDKTPKNSVEYPVENSFEKYTLTEGSCHWKVFAHDKVIVVNNDEELQNYVECIDTTYSQVDFSKYSLLLLRGHTTSSPVEVVQTKLTQTAENKYVVYVKVRAGMAGMPDSWTVAITTKKLCENDVITLDVEQEN